jgi:hypothetical protein
MANAAMAQPKTTAFGELLQQALTGQAAPPPQSPPKKQKTRKPNSTIALVVNNDKPKKTARKHILFNREKPGATFDGVIDYLYGPYAHERTKPERKDALRALLRLIGSGTLSFAMKFEAASILEDAHEFGDIDNGLRVEAEAAYAAASSRRKKKG